ncbi:MAG TPA: hypothetical protein VNA26_09290, partial [Chitinophagaceae bacterium]|nr:hypothetical protein [Chitinophagaceae bacterium]
LTSLTLYKNAFLQDILVSEKQPIRMANFQRTELKLFFIAFIYGFKSEKYNHMPKTNQMNGY